MTPQLYQIAAPEGFVTRAKVQHRKSEMKH